MKSIKLIAAIAFAALLASCGQNSSSYKKLQSQYDSLEMVNKQADQNLEEMLAIINEVEQNFQDMKEAENMVTIKQRNGEMTADTREEIRNNMRLFSETLKENRAQLEKLQAELKKNKVNSKALNDKVAQMMKQLETKEAELIMLRNELASKDIRINELDSAVNQLNTNVQTLAEQNQQQSQTIKKQDSSLHTAYYCFGTLPELKEQKILSGGGLFSAAKVLPEGFNKDYFLAIDTREVKSIPLFAKKARIRTQHPASSYEFVKDDEGNMTINITNPTEFWSLTKYLVIEVN